MSGPDNRFQVRVVRADNRFQVRVVHSVSAVVET